MTEVASTSSSGFPSDSDDWSFKPSDESLALDFLRPMASGPAVPDGTCIIADDPYRVEPWKLLAAYQRDVAEGAYFLTKKAVLSSKGLRRKRTVGDADKIVGTWRVQHSKNDSNADKTVRWCKTLLSYYNADDNSKTTGYVMHEYELYKDGGEGCKGKTHERVICHIKLSDREISRRKRRRKESATASAAAAASSSNTCPSISSPASDSLFGSGWTNSPYPASWLAPWSVAFHQPAPYEASLVAAGNAYALCSATSSEFVHEEALPDGIVFASTNLNPWSSATTCSSMLQHGNNPAEYYPYPYSCTEPPPLSHALPQPPVAAAVPFKTAQQQQQPSAPSEANAEGTAEPPPDCNGVWEKDIHIENENAEQQQQQQQQPRSNSNADAATTAAATHGDDFSDDYISFIEFDDINNLYDDDELEKLVGEITAEPFEVPDDGDPPYFL